MAWRPYGNLIDGELSNSVPGKVTGWIRFFRQGKKPLKVTLDLSGDFHEDIRGRGIRLSNPNPSDREDDFDVGGTYLEGFSARQRGTAGDITAGLSLGPWTPAIIQTLMAQHELRWDEHGVQGSERDERRRPVEGEYQTHVEAGDLFYPYVAYPYIEWYSEANGRVVLELDPSQVEVLSGSAPVKKKAAAEFADDERKRAQALAFMTGMLEQFSEENRDPGGDGKVFGAVINS